MTICCICEKRARNLDFSASSSGGKSIFPWWLPRFVGAIVWCEKDALFHPLFLSKQTTHTHRIDFGDAFLGLVLERGCDSCTNSYTLNPVYRSEKAESGLMANRYWRKNSKSFTCPKNACARRSPLLNSIRAHSYRLRTPIRACPVFPESAANGEFPFVNK